MLGDLQESQRRVNNQKTKNWTPFSYIAEKDIISLCNSQVDMDWI